MTASLGVSLFPADGEAAETLLECADIAMSRDTGKTEAFSPRRN